MQETYVYTAGSNRIKRIESQSSSVALPSIDREFVYNDANRLKEVWDAGALTGSYIHNAQGQRTRKTTDQGTTVYHYDLQGLLIAETEADGSLIREYIWQGGEPLAQIDVSGGVETLIYLHTDHLMTPRLATDASGTVVWRWEGEAFGESATQEDPDGDGLLTEVNLRFPGQYFDSESGLVQNWFREYDPSTGRYLQSDLIGLDGGINTYGYVGGNPLYWIDSYGLDPHQWADGNYSDNDGQENPGLWPQIEYAYSQVGTGIAEGWVYSPAIAIGTGEGIVALSSIIKGCFSKDILLLGRGTPDVLRPIADKLGARVIDTELRGKELYKHIYGEARKSDKILQILDGIPDALIKGKKGQWSRMEKLLIDNVKNLEKKTTRGTKEDFGL